MVRPLVVVESPAKAKTISKFLGNAYDVRASVGHVADLPSKGLAVDVDNGFKPTYELTERGKQVVKELRAALKDASELYLATDEDREGEAISWHLLEHLKPKVPVKRMVFHEITQDAIDHAVNNPRWPRLRAGRRRRDPQDPRPAVWLRGLTGALAAGQQGPLGGPGAEPGDPPHRRARARAHRLRRRRLLGHRADAPARRRPSRPTWSPWTACRVASGKDFDAGGRASAKLVVLDELRARALADGLDGADFRVRSVEEKPYRSSPRPPFMTSDAAAGGRPQAAPVVVAGDARRPGPVRAGLHHLHAHGQRWCCPPRRWARCAPRWPASTGSSSCHRAHGSTRPRRRTPRRRTRPSAPPRRCARRTRCRAS